MKNWQSRCILIIAILGILLGSISNLRNVRAEEQETVRIGFYEMDGFLSCDAKGNPKGYNADYLSRIAMITGWSYEYIQVKDLNEGMEMLQAHKIDFLAPCQMTAEQMEQFDFSVYSFGIGYTVLVTGKENDFCVYEDFESFEGMCIGVVKDYLITDNFLKYMEEKGFQANLQYYNTPAEALEALDNGQTDAAVADFMMAGEKYKVLARFSPLPFYYATWKGNKTLLGELDEAMQSLKNTYPNLENDLMELYFPIYKEQYFSKEEKEFIESLGPLKVAYIPERLPISFQNKETGELDGISRKIFDRIQEITGLKFEYEVLPQGQITYDYLRERGFDLITGVEYNSTNLNASGIQISNPYLSAKKVIVGRNDLIFDKNTRYKVAVVSGSQTIKKELETKYPNFEIVSYDYMEECFEGVLKGKVDLLIQDQYIVENWMSKPKYESLSIIPVSDLDDKLCFSAVLFQNGAGERGDLDNVKLIAIINKAISQISQDELNTIILTSTMNNRYTYTFSDFCYRYRYTLMITALALVLGLFVAGDMIGLKKREQLIKREEENQLILQQKRYRLVMDNSDELIFEIGLKENASIISDKMKEKFGWDIPRRVKKPSVEELLEICHVHPDESAQLKETLLGVMQGKQVSEKLFRVRKENGDYIWCRMSLFPLMDRENKLVSLVGKIVDVNQEIIEKELLEIKSKTDDLTGIMNRRTFTEETEKYLSAHSAAATGIIFVDLDYFKNVNDTLGHTIGDKAIREAARKLQVIFANVDLVARFGGDEFCVFVKNIPKETLMSKLEWTVDKLKAVYSDGEKEAKITASIGAAYCVREYADYQTLLELADHAVYEAKENGRNQYIIKVI